MILFSLERTAIFHIQTPGMTRWHSFKIESGDALAFDPSSEAAVIHSVIGVAYGEEKASAREDELETLGERFDVLRISQLYVQCRASLVE